MKLAKKVKAPKVQATGQLQEMVHKIENLTAESAFTEAKSLFDTIEENYFRIGGILAVMQEKGWYTEKGYEDFRTCIEKEFGVRYRKAMYLIQIYNNLVASGIDWTKVKHLGWSKVAAISPILTEANLDKMVKKAEDSTVIQLQEYIHALEEKKANKGKGDDAADESSEVSTMTFKLYKQQREVVDEALNKAKSALNTDANNVALETICMDFMQEGPSAKPKGQKDLKMMMSEVGYEKVLETFEGLWPEIEVQVTA